MKENEAEEGLPKKLDEPDLRRLSRLIGDYIEALSGDERPKEGNYENAIYEAAMEAFYGDDIFDRYINPASARFDKMEEEDFDKMEEEDESELNR